VEGLPVGKRKGEPGVVNQLRTAIRAARDGGRSLYQLGKDTGVGRDRLSRFLRGERDLTGAAIDRVCRVLGLELVQTRRARPPVDPRPRGRPRKVEGE
jgi:DNA-binding phage protein